MLTLNLQCFGGRGGAGGGGGGKGLPDATGGKTSTLKYTNGNSVKIASWIENDGMIRSFEVGISAHVGGNLKSENYDIFMQVNGTDFATTDKSGRAWLNPAYIGVNLNTPKGVSAKQESYAKSVLTRNFRSFLAGTFENYNSGKEPKKTEEYIKSLKNMPAMDARAVLDRFL